jgi:general secretion pathway protein I
MSAAGPSQGARLPLGGQRAAQGGEHTSAAKDPGFTLIEMLVALALLAVALTAGMRALAQAADGAGTLKARTLALWVAQNRLAAIQIAPDALTANAQGRAEQAGMAFVWRVSVGGTPNPAFRRVDIVVAEATVPDYALARLTGYVSRASR